MSITPPLATTDDCQISCNISIDLPPKTTLSRHIWLYSEADWEGLNAAIINHDWQAHLDRQNVNAITPFITQSFINLARQFIPNKIVTIPNAGVPQSFVLGPLFFLVYKNDMEEGLTSKLTLFADDNLLLSISKCHIINFANTKQRPRKTRSVGATMDCQLQRFKNKQYGG